MTVRVPQRAAFMIAAAIAVFLVGAPGAQSIPGEGWYESDAAGMAFGPVAGPGGLGYALFVSARGGDVRSELFRDGKPVKSWIRRYDATGVLLREAVEQDGVISSELLYDAQGRPDFEREFLAGGAVRETAYEYQAGRLVSNQLSEGGEVVSTTTYLYAPDGRLALASESSGGGHGTTSGRSGRTSTWRVSGEALELRVYDRDGRLVSVASYRGAELISREERSWRDGALVMTVVENGGKKMTTEYAADGTAAGKPLVLTAEADGVAVSVERRAYDETGRLSTVETTARGRTTLVENAYDEAGALYSTRTSIAGALISIVNHESPDVRVEELYDAGVAFARVRYEDGRRVLEEILKDGVVVRSRRFD